ncbi:hypothetical protein FHW12_003130 [Dokdonella fugitiva]|uniref:Uncharacterized protein n=1 Tax=Dokdonella fugitiva TaxID=328517 RepID=A0A839F9U2_9GAMM|nr:hypothetical protein [Dokdonella fugitiva]MBA8888894.1 hypothetical protein [Dokdonella fugitiva]
MNLAILPRQRSLEELLADAAAGSQRMSIATRSWPGFAPGVPQIDEALNTVAGLQKTLAELRANREANR